MRRILELEEQLDDPAMAIDGGCVDGQPALDRQRLDLLGKLPEQHIDDLELAVVAGYVQGTVLGDRVAGAVGPVVQQQLHHVALAGLAGDEQEGVGAVRGHVDDVLEIGEGLALDYGAGSRAVGLHAGHAEGRVRVQACFFVSGGAGQK